MNRGARPTFLVVDETRQVTQAASVTFLPAGALSDAPTARQLEDAVQAGKRNAHPILFKEPTT